MDGGDVEVVLALAPDTASGMGVGVGVGVGGGGTGRGVEVGVAGALPELPEIPDEPEEPEEGDVPPGEVFEDDVAFVGVRVGVDEVGGVEVAMSDGVAVAVALATPGNCTVGDGW